MTRQIQNGVLIFTGNDGMAEDIVINKDYGKKYPCEVPTLLGVPIWVSIVKRGKNTCNRVTRLLIEKQSGLAPFQWSAGCYDSNDVIVGRADMKDFTCKDYYNLDDYIVHLLDQYCEDDGIPDDMFTPQSYQDFLESRIQKEPKIDKKIDFKLKEATKSEKKRIRYNQDELMDFVRTNPYPKKEEIIAFNIKYNKPERNDILGDEIYQLCTEIYQSIAGDQDKITLIMRQINNKYGFHVMQLCFSIVTNSVKGFIEDSELGACAQGILNDQIEGIGGWKV